MGDQLTVERARNVVKSRLNASSPPEALKGLQPAICDWHAECVLLQICTCNMSGNTYTISECWSEHVRQHIYNQRVLVSYFSFYIRTYIP